MQTAKHWFLIDIGFCERKLFVEDIIENAKPVVRQGRKTTGPHGRLPGRIPFTRLQKTGTRFLAILISYIVYTKTFAVTI